MFSNRDQEDITPNFVESVSEIHLEERIERPGFRAALDADAQLMGSIDDLSEFFLGSGMKVEKSRPISPTRDLTHFVKLLTRSSFLGTGRA